jgi:hypothetical protein
MVILTQGQGERLKKYLDWSITHFKMQADELNEGDYSPELRDAMEIQGLVDRELGIKGGKPKNENV